MEEIDRSLRKERPKIKKKEKKRARVEDGHCVIRCVGVEDAVDRPPVNFY